MHRAGAWTTARWVQACACALFFGAVAAPVACSSSSPPTGKASSGPSTHDKGEDDDEVARDAWLKIYYGNQTATADYLAFKQRVAAQAAQEWSQTLASALSTTSATTPTWTNLGPFSGVGLEGPTSIDSGRLRAIVTHPTNPQIVYVAAAGGVFKATNASLASTTPWNWTSLTDSLPASSLFGNTSVGDLAMSPSDPQTLYLGLGDPVHGVGAGAAMGFFVTHDGGATWTKGGSMGSSLHVWKILPIDANTLLVGTDQALWRSADGGTTFTQITFPGDASPPLNLTPNITSIVRFGDGTLVCADWTQFAGVFFSTDNGLTWTPSTVTGTPSPGTLGRMTFAVAPSTTNTAYAIGSNGDGGADFYPGVFKSTDSGHTWSFVASSSGAGTINTAQGDYNQLLAVDPTNPNTVFLGTVDMYRSFDGGLTWAQADGPNGSTVHSDFHVAAWSQTGPKTLFVGDDGGLAVFLDPLRVTVPATADPTYVDLSRNIGLATHLLYSVASTTASSPADSRFRVGFGSQDNGARLRVDAGAGLATSGQFNTLITGDSFGSAYNRTNGNLFIANLNGNFWRTADNGQTVTAIRSPVFPTFEFGTPIVAHRADPTGNTLLAAGGGGGFLPVESTDFGATWNSLSVTGLEKGYMALNFAGAPTNVNVIASVGNGPTTDGYVSNDGGMTWTAITSPAPNAFLRAIAIDPTNPSILYVGGINFSSTVAHVWKSVDQGKTWRVIDGTGGQPNGFPPAFPVWVLRIDPNNASSIYAGTDLGVYHSADGGNTWSRLGVGLPIIGVRDLFVADDSSFVRAATYGRGVWELPIVGGTSGDGGVSDGGGDGSTEGGAADAATEGGADAAADAGNTSADSGADSSVDSGTDAAADSGADATVDAGADARADAAIEAGKDSGSDAGADASSGCTVATAVDLGVPGTNVTIGNNGCLRVLNGYPSWWGTSRTMQLQDTSPGTYPVPFAWSNACAGSSGTGTFTGDFQSLLLTPTSSACATLIQLKGSGAGNITVHYFGQ